MIAVTSAMIAPSIFSIGGADIDEESEHLRTVLSYALEEAQLSGQPMRWLAKKDGWSFEVWIESFGQNEHGKVSWQPWVEPPLAPYRLPEGIVIQQVNQAGDTMYESAFDLHANPGSSSGKEYQKPLLGVVLFLPDGTTSQSNIYLADKFEKTKVLQVRPGPAGIRLQKEGEY